VAQSRAGLPATGAGAFRQGGGNAARRCPLRRPAVFGGLVRIKELAGQAGGCFGGGVEPAADSLFPSNRAQQMTAAETGQPPDRPAGAAGRFCILVSSSDRGRDIFEIVFQNAEEIWRGCDWPRYVGFTRPQPDMYGFKAIA